MFDCIFLMGPLYHIQNENDRKKCLNEVVKHLHDGGLLFASFIQPYAGIQFYLSSCPQEIINEKEYESLASKLETNDTWIGKGFTETIWIDIDKIEPLLSSYGFKMLTMFSQEGIIGGHTNMINSLDENCQVRWLDVSIRLCENKRYLTHGEHIMYVGKKEIK